MMRPRELREMRGEAYHAEELQCVHVRGGLHAAYRTGLRTLCLIECEPKGEGLALVPDCRECTRVMAAWQEMVEREELTASGIPRKWKPWIALFRKWQEEAHA